MAKVLATPGVYIEEKSAFPNSAVPVDTAVPAFIGYTEKAVKNKKSLLLTPTRITSFGDYLEYFGGGPSTKFEVAANTEKPELIYKLTAKHDTRFLLYHSMKLFFANGGSKCYIVSVGNYMKTDPTDATKKVANKVEKGELEKAFDPLLKEPEPTMLVMPDAMLLVGAKDDDIDLDNSGWFDLQVKMLRHCGVDMRNRFSILDVPHQSDDLKSADVVESFRNQVGSTNLQWGAAYYPWLETTIVQASEIDFTHIDSANLGAATDIINIDAQYDAEGQFVDKDAFQTAVDGQAITNLISLLDKATNQDAVDGLIKLKRAQAIKKELEKIPTVTKASDIITLHQTLLAISPTYKSVLTDIRKSLNLLPPSGAMAGIYSMVDNTVGVFQSPANISVGSTVRPAVDINNEEQEDLNVPLTGKAVNAIRTFPGKGVLVWGARTLDGNSLDWRYVSVRRTVIFIEQSIKYAAEPYVFAPNTASTWSNMNALITNFLTNVWQSGALAGATAEDAFSVDVGLGSTMTSLDILEGIMRVSVKLAVTRPAEFIVITFEQKMQQS